MPLTEMNAKTLQDRSVIRYTSPRDDDTTWDDDTTHDPENCPHK